MQAMPPEVAEAICSVMSQMTKLPKSERNLHGGYDFASIDAFLAAMNPLCAEAGLYIWQNEESVEIVPPSQPNKAPALRAVFSHIICHKSGKASTPVRRTVMVPATGAQAFGSAQSYALKQFMRATFMIATGDKDDPDFQKAEPLPQGGATSGSRKPADPGLARGEKTKHGDNKTALQAKLREFIRDVMAASDESELDGVIAGYGAMIEDVRQHFPSWWDGGGNDDGEPPVRIIERVRRQLQAQAAAPEKEESSLPDLILESMRRNQTVDELKAWKENNRVVVSDLPQEDRDRIQDAYKRHLHDISQAPHPEAAQ